ncbi:SAV_2336 N-terminal domain-related protein [Streptomyces tsukubensis]|uniref:SAV_2336 N-terminal domain-related protein n=1 Tax=Streptomyces tsukubensis TaxID=83656 RepID=UPI0036BC7205
MAVEQGPAGASAGAPEGAPAGPPEPPGARLGELLGVFRAVDRELDAEQVLDVLWLARLLPPGDAGAPLAAPAAEVPPPAGDEAPGPAPREDPTAGDGEREGPNPGAPALYAAARQRPAPRAGPEPELRRPASRAGRPQRALPVLVPESKALTDQLELGRSLRPLRYRRADRDRLEIDIERTVAALAETRVPDVVQRPVRERWLRLVLLVDDGLSMLLWHRLGAELRGLLVRLGAFASLRVHGLDTRARGGPRLRARPFREDSSELPLTGVNDPSGRTLVLVVSDGMGTAWRTGGMHELLRSWAARGPVAVVHTLPPELWEASGIQADRWVVTTRATGGANTSWEISDPVLPRDLAVFDGVPVPVLEATPPSLGRWSKLLVSPGATAELPLLARPSVRAPVAAAATLTSAQHFRDAATPEAYRLAAHLAAVAPLSVPVMRLVQEAVPWRADTSQLAEVFLGGLLRPYPAPVPAGEPLPAKHRVFDFTEESRTALLDAVPQAELLLTGRRIGQQLERLAGRSPDFPAWLAHPSGHADLPAGRRPFTHVEQKLLSRFGVPLDASARRTAPPSDPAGRTDTAGDGGWRPLLPDDPVRLGPYRLTDRRPGRRTLVYRGQDRQRRAAVLRVPRPDQPAATVRLLDTEAEALTRLDGRYAPVLLDRGTEGQVPWLAMSRIAEDDDPDAQPPRISDLVEEAASTGQAPFDTLPGLFAAWQLASAVDVCHVNGLVPAALTADSVFVLRRSIVLGDLSDCAVDGEYAGTGPVPVPADTVYALGELLQIISTRAGEPARHLPEGMHKWQGDTWDLLRSTVLRCLDADPANRPTAGELADLLSRYLAMHQVQHTGGTGATSARRGPGGDEAGDGPAGPVHDPGPGRPALAAPRSASRDRLIRLGRFQGRGGPRRAEDRALLQSLRAPLPYGLRLTLAGGRMYDGRAGFTAALGSLLAAVRGEPVLALDGSPVGGALEQCLVEGRNPASWKEFAALPDGASYEQIRARTTVLPAGLEVVAHHRYLTFRVNPSHPQEYMRVLGLTAPYYSFVLTDWNGELDGGGGSGSSGGGGGSGADVVLNHTDRLLVFARTGQLADADRILAGLRHSGRDELSAGLLLVVTEPLRTAASDPAAVAEWAGIRPDQVVIVPRELQAPYRFWDLEQLPPATVRGLLAVAKLLVTGR